LKILWRPWVDPFLPAIKKKRKKKLDDWDIAKSTFVTDKNSDDTIVPCLSGPMGIIPIHEGNTPSANYNFWMGDCDFDLTFGVVEKIEMVRGVETLDIFTRYRFRVAIGRAFDPKTVMQSIEEAVNDEEETCF
jgi:hypothetical protein